MSKCQKHITAKTKEGAEARAYNATPSLITAFVTSHTVQTISFYFCNTITGFVWALYASPHISKQ